MSFKENPLISVIIPNKNDWNFVLCAAKAIKNQSYKNIELIIVDSSSFHSDNAYFAEELKKLFPLNLTIHQSKQSFPGKARNLGAALARGIYIAFMDAKTIPHQEWLHSYLRDIVSSSSDINIGRFYSDRDNLNWLQKLIKANTYGNILRNSVPGSLLLKTRFLESQGFNEQVGAGEDLEWVNRLRNLKWKINQSPIAAFRYVGYPNTFIKFLKKWIFYSIENAKLNILSMQKSIYLLLLASFVLYFIYSWNYIFTNGAWDDSPNFIPNLNTVIWSIIFIAYFILRAIILPLLKKEKLFYIFPFNWLLIGCVGFLIDILKIPGRIYGIWRILKSTQDL